MSSSIESVRTPRAVQRVIGVLPLALALLVACGRESGPAPAGPEDAPAQPAARSCVLVTIDTLRADHLSAYGYGRATSPRLDAFLERGVRFEYGFSTAPRTAPAHVSILTGLYPSFNSVGHLNSRFRLEDSVDTLAEHARDAGLRTGAIVSNPVLGRSSGLAQGFEAYDDSFPQTETMRAAAEKVAEPTASTAIAALEAWRDERFFLWIHFQDPHGPYTPPAGHADAFAGDGLAANGPVLRAGSSHAGLGELPRYQLFGEERALEAYVRRYDAEIRYLDEQLGRVLDALDRLGLADETFFAITADHGEAFGEEGYFCAHGHGVSMDQTRVPLAFVGPAVKPGVVLEGPASNLNVFATVLDALGIEGVDRMQSRSLMPALREGVEPDPRVEYAESVTQRAAFGPAGYALDNSRPLSDTAFWQQRNPYTHAPYVPLDSPRLESWGDGADALRAQLERFQGQADIYRARLAAAERGEVVLSDEDEQRLRALGYVD